MPENLNPLKSDLIRKWFVGTGVILIFFWGGLRFYGIRIGINLTRSQPDWVYLVISEKEVRRGERAAFWFQGSRYYPAGTLFVKKVAGLPGDRLDSGSGGIWINGEKIGDVRTADSKGRSVTPYVYHGAIPAGAYFMIAEVSNSYDSRYFGLIEERQLIGKVISLF